MPGLSLPSVDREMIPIELRSMSEVAISRFFTGRVLIRN